MAKIRAFSELTNIFAKKFTGRIINGVLMKKIIGIGNALVDVMTRLDSETLLDKLSFPKGSMQLVDIEKSRVIKEKTARFVDSQASGGSAANTIHGLAMLGVETGFIGSIGNDTTGKIFENDMKSAGVKTHLLRKNTETGTAVAMITPDSERTFATHLGAATEMGSEDLDPLLFLGYDIFYIEGYLITNIELVQKACKIAKDMGLKIVIDLASFNVVDAFIDDFRDIVDRYVDIIFANEDEAKSFTGLGPHESLEMLGSKCEIAVVKIGKEGSLIKRGDEELTIGSLDVTSIDTTGAGDLYAAGFLYGLAREDSLKKCGQYGTLLAANVIGVFGPKMEQERWSKIKRQLINIQIGESL